MAQRGTPNSGAETSVVRMHSGNGPHDEMDRRAIACFDWHWPTSVWIDERHRRFWTVTSVGRPRPPSRVTTTPQRRTRRTAGPPVVVGRSGEQPLKIDLPDTKLLSCSSSAQCVASDVAERLSGHIPLALGSLWWAYSTLVTVTPVGMVQLTHPVVEWPEDAGWS